MAKILYDCPMSLREQELQPEIKIGATVPFSDLFSQSVDIKNLHSDNPTIEPDFCIKVSSDTSPYPIGMQFLLSETTLPYLAIRPLQEDAGYEFSNDDFDQNQRLSKFRRLARLSARARERNRSLNLLDRPYSISVSAEILELHNEESIDPQEIRYLDPGHGPLVPILRRDTTQLDTANRLRLQVHAKGVYQSTPLLSDPLNVDAKYDTKTNHGPGTIEMVDTYSFYPTDIGPVKHRFPVYGGQYELEIVGAEVSFTLRELMRDEVDIRFVLENSGNHQA